MFCRNFMPRTNDAALEQRERGLDSVRRNVAVDVNSVVMIHGPMHYAAIKSCLRQRTFVGRPLRRVGSLFPFLVVP